MQPNEYSKYSELYLENLLDSLKPGSKEFIEVNEELDKRADLFTRRLEIEKIAEKKIEEERYQAKLAAFKVDISNKWNFKFDGYEGWLTWAKSLYIIHENFNVESKAVRWSEERVWICENEYEAIEKIEQLLSYKYYDHFKRSK